MISPRFTLGLAFLALAPAAPAEILQFRGGGFGQPQNQGKEIDHNAMVPTSDPAGSDLIRFENGDIMHGEFAGMKDGLLWKRPDIEKPIRFLRTDTIRQIIFNGHEAAQLGDDISYITLISGDRIPGKITAMVDDELSLESPVVGSLTIPRDRIRSISPNPYGGELLYAGPFNSNGWMRLSYRSAEVEAPDQPEPKAEEAEAEPEEPKEEKKVIPSWIYSGAAFYSIKRAPLVFDANLPDVGRIRFKASYKSQMNLAIALHADLSRPILEAAADDEAADAAGDEEAEEENEKKAPLEFESLTDLHKNKPLQTISWMKSGQSNYADFFGTSYVLNIYSSYPALNRSTFNDEGRAIHSRLTGVRNSVALPTSGETEIEIRFDRNKNLIMLFIDGKYSSQWNDPAGYLAKGGGIGFLNSSSGNQIKISDIVVTTWNGVRDSALSMEHPERDIVLLTNGTDRFSGKLDRIENDNAYLKSSFAEVVVPLKELSKIELSSEGRADPDEKDFEWETEPASVLFQPFGLIYLNPTSSTADTLSGTSPYLGELKINLKSASMLRLLDESPDISDWFDEL